MTILQNSKSLPNLGISSSSPNDSTTSSEQLTPSKRNGFKPILTGERDEHPHPTVDSPYTSHPTNPLPSHAAPGAVPPSTYLESHTTSTGTATPPNDIQLVATRPSPSYATEARYRRQRRSSCHSATADLPSLNSELFRLVQVPAQRTFATSSSRVYRHAEGVRYAIPTSGAHA
jgi:hypothetical protein